MFKKTLKFYLAFSIALSAVLLFPSNLSAETRITDGDLYEGGLWTKDMSPYILEDYVSIPSGQKLVVEAGVSIMSASSTEFGEPYSIRNRGEMYILGNVDDHVALHDLGSISLNGGIAVINHAELKNTGIFASQADLKMNSSSIKGAFEAIFAKKSKIEILHSEISENEYGIISDLYSSGPVLSIVDSSAIGGPGMAEPDPDQNIISVKDSVLEGNKQIAINNLTTNFIDATDNWWGNSSGPMDSVSGAVLVEPWKTEDPMVIKEACCSNVLFLPGLKASRLYKDSTGFLGTSSDRLWEPNIDQDVKDLYMSEDGKSIDPKIYVKGIVDSAFGLKDIYKSFIAMMNGVVADKVINEWTPFAYDWRNDVSDLVSADLLSEFSRLAESSKTGKVTIVAHSNGGLLAKALGRELEKIGKIDLVDKAIFVAVPQLGTPQSIASLLHGSGESILNGIIAKASTARALGNNMPGAYGLLPSPEYFNDLLSPIISFASSSISSYKDFFDFAIAKDGLRAKPEGSDLDTPEILSENLLTEAKTLHENIDSWNFPPNVQSYNVSGWGMYTTNSIKYEDKGFAIEKTIDGDGTVVSLSSKSLSNTAPTAYFNQGQFKKEAQKDIDHSEIMGAGPVKSFLSEIISKNTASVGDLNLPNYMSWEKPDISDYPWLGTLVISVHSPVDIDVYDGKGGHIGLVPLGSVAPEYKDSDFMYLEDTIGGDYEDLAGRKYIRIPYSGGEEYTVKLSGTGVGTFTFMTQKVDNYMNEIASTTYTDLPVTPFMVASTSINTSTLSQTMQIDVDGDGSVDIKAKPSSSGDPLMHLEAMRKAIKSLGLKPLAEKLILAKVLVMEKLVKSGKGHKWLTRMKKLSDHVGDKHWHKNKISESDRRVILDMFNKFLDSYVI